MTPLPRYVATCTDEDYVTFWGGGDTPGEAYSEFMEGGEFEGYCQYQGIPESSEVEIYIYSIVSVEDSDWDPGDLEEGIDWVLDKKIDTRLEKAPP